MSAKAVDNAFSDPRTGLVLALGVAAIVVYLILKNAVSGIANGVGSAFSAADAAVNAAVDPLTTDIAAAIVPAGPAERVTGNIVFPDGSTASVASVSAVNNGLTTPNFYWYGMPYTLTGSFDSGGNRIATAGTDQSTIASTWQ